MKKRSGRGRPGAESASIAGDLMLAPMVALMRLPLMATETQRAAAWRTETNGAVSEKLAAVAEGVDGRADFGDAIGAQLLAGDFRGPRAVPAVGRRHGAFDRGGAEAGEPAGQGEFQAAVWD